MKLWDETTGEIKVQKVKMHKNIRMHKLCKQALQPVHWQKLFLLTDFSDDTEEVSLVYARLEVNIYHATEYGVASVVIY